MTEKAKHVLDQFDWREQAKHTDLGTLEHVLSAHIENAMDVESVLRLAPKTVAKLLLDLRSDVHRERMQDDEEYEKIEATIAELEAWKHKACALLFDLRFCTDALHGEIDEILDGWNPLENKKPTAV